MKFRQPSNHPTTQPPQPPQVRSKYRSLYPAQLTMLLEGLAALGYKPREEICWSLQAQARRQLHAFVPGQQATVIRAMAMHSK